MLTYTNSCIFQFSSWNIFQLFKLLSLIIRCGMIIRLIIFQQMSGCWCCSWILVSIFTVIFSFLPNINKEGFCKVFFFLQWLQWLVKLIVLSDCTNEILCICVTSLYTQPCSVAGLWRGFFNNLTEFWVRHRYVYTAGADMKCSFLHLNVIYMFIYFFTPHSGAISIETYALYVRLVFYIRCKSEFIFITAVRVISSTVKI